jgi:Ca-activated chloride channel family protein
MKGLVAAIALSIAIGQTPRSPFRSGVDVVRVDALVTSDGRTIAGLTAADFELRDNGVPQEIDSVTIDDVPVSMLLALDTSNSVEGETLHRLKEAAIAAVDALGPDDRAAVLTFSNVVTLRAVWSTPAPAMREAIAAAPAGGTTSLYDALHAALAFRDDLPGRRPFVVLFSDGGDSSSWLPARAILERARRTDAVVYIVTLRPPRRDTRLEYRSGIELWPSETGATAGPPPMVELATLTGGSTFVAERPAKLRDAFSSAVAQFRNRYLISYRPRGVETAGWHAINLKLKGRSGTVTARRGYAK